jgi:hypothetical protein
VVDFEAAADGSRDGPEVAGVGADDQVAAAQGSLVNARVDDVGAGRTGRERAGGAGPGVVQVWVPRSSSTSRDQAIFVHQATDASLSSDAVLLEIDRFG